MHCSSAHSREDAVVRQVQGVFASRVERLDGIRHTLGFDLSDIANPDQIVGARLELPRGSRFGDARSVVVTETDAEQPVAHGRATWDRFVIPLPPQILDRLQDAAGGYFFLDALLLDEDGTRSVMHELGAPARLTLETVHQTALVAAA
jgi:hypothetical protein